MARWLDTLTAAKPSDLYGVRLLKDAPASLAAPVSNFKPAVNKSQMSVTCILTTDRADRQGDVIDPSGGDFSEHVTNPVVMFHHGKTHKLPIGKAEDPDGNYTVRLVKSADGPVLCGTTHFAQSNRFAQDVFGLVAEDVLRGVSIGFDPLDDADSIDELGPSPVLKRSALHFKGWKLLEYSHTPLGVNRDALTVAVHKAMDGSRRLDPRLLSMLRPLAAPRRTTVAVSDADPTRVEKGAGCAGMPLKQKRAVALNKARKAGKKVPPVEKAMPMPSQTAADDDEDTDDETQPEDNEDTDSAGATDDAGADAGAGGDDTDPGATGEGDYDPAQDDPNKDPMLADSGYAQPDPDQPPPPTVQTLTDGAQGLLDLCSAIEGGMKQSEHMKGRKYAAKLCADLKRTAAEVSGFAQKVQSELSGNPMGGDNQTGEDTAPGDDSDNDDVPPEEPETDDDGAIVTKGGYAPRRWTFADLANAAPAPQVAPTPDARQLKALKRENAELKRALARTLDDVEAADRRGR